MIAFAQKYDPQPIHTDKSAAKLSVYGGLIASGIARSDEDPIRIILAGYGPPSSSFSQALTHIGNRLTDKFGDDVEAIEREHGRVLGDSSAREQRALGLARTGSRNTLS